MPAPREPDTGAPAAVNTHRPPSLSPTTSRPPPAGPPDPALSAPSAGFPDPLDPASSAVSHRFAPTARPQPSPRRGKVTCAPSSRTHTAASSPSSRRASRALDHPGPNAPASSEEELYTRISARAPHPPANARSISGSMKLPVSVLTGSSAYPVVT